MRRSLSAACAARSSSGTRSRTLASSCEASFGVADPSAGQPRLLTLDGFEPFEAGGQVVDTVQVCVYNDDPAFAPAGHSVIQASLPMPYEWWATRGTRYGAEKEAIAERLLATLQKPFPSLRSSLRMTDVATPLTFWTMARSWRGAYEGWMPSAEGILGHVKKTLAGLDHFYMAGQWVEPGGGVPIALMSGRQVMQLICKGDFRPG